MLNFYHLHFPFKVINGAESCLSVVLHHVNFLWILGQAIAISWIQTVLDLCPLLFLFLIMSSVKRYVFPIALRIWDIRSLLGHWKICCLGLFLNVKVLTTSSFSGSPSLFCISFIFVIIKVVYDKKIKNIFFHIFCCIHLILINETSVL